MPLNVTLVAPVKSRPLIVTAVPTGPLVGENPVIVAVTRKLFALIAVPPGPVTLIGPALTPEGTVASIRVSERTLMSTAAVPLNLTAVVPTNPLPVIVTSVPACPLSGWKFSIVSTGSTVKLAALVAVPPGAVTATGPVVPPAGTVA